MFCIYIFYLFIYFFWLCGDVVYRIYIWIINKELNREIMVGETNQLGARLRDNSTDTCLSCECGCGRKDVNVKHVVAREKTRNRANETTTGTRGGRGGRFDKHSWRMTGTWYLYRVAVSVFSIYKYARATRVYLFIFLSYFNLHFFFTSLLFNARSNIHHFIYT